MMDQGSRWPLRPEEVSRSPTVPDVAHEAGQRAYSRSENVESIDERNAVNVYRPPVRPPITLMIFSYTVNTIPPLN